MKTREEIQNDYWAGAEIEDHRFHHLNLERKSLLQGVWGQAGGRQRVTHRGGPAACGDGDLQYDQRGGRRRGA